MTGYDLHTKSGYNHMMTELEEIVGLQYLKAVHINDSKGEQINSSKNSNTIFMNSTKKTSYPPILHPSTL